MIGLDYGNARVRVRASLLLDIDDYRELIGSSSLEAMLGRLASGPYGAAVERSLGRHSGLRRLDEAVRSHLSRQLSDVLSFYSGEIAERLRLYEARWDIRNIRSILRSLADASTGERSIPLLVSTGTLDDAALDEIAGRGDVRSAVDLLGVWQLPGPQVVHHLRRATGRYTETGDVSHLETALDRALEETVGEAISRFGPDDPVITTLRRELDRINLMSCARLLALSDQTPEWRPLDGGMVPAAVWSEAMASGDRQDIASRVSGGLPASWRGPLGEWVEHGDPTRLEGRIDDAWAEDARISLRRDPLGIETPLGYLGRLEAEAKNLRMVGRAIVHEIPHEEAVGLLVGAR